MGQSRREDAPIILSGDPAAREDYDQYSTRRIAENAVEQITVGKITTSILALIHFSDVPIAMVT
jgi:hypothetical protein